MSASPVALPSIAAVDPAAAWARHLVEVLCAQGPSDWPGFRRPIVVASADVFVRLFGFAEDVTDAELEGIGVRVDAFVTVLPPDLIRVTWAGRGHHVYVGPASLREDEAEIYHTLRVDGLEPDEAADIARAIAATDLSA